METYQKPIPHCSKKHEIPRKSVLELIKIIQRIKHKRGPPPWPRGWGARPPLQGATPCLVGPMAVLRCPSFAI